MKTIIFAAIISVFILAGCGVARPGDPGYYPNPPQQVYFAPDPNYYGNNYYYTDPYYTGTYYGNARRNYYYRQQPVRREYRPEERREEKREVHDNNRRNDHDRDDHKPAQVMPFRKFNPANSGTRDEHKRD